MKYTVNPFFTAVAVGAPVWSEEEVVDELHAASAMTPTSVAARISVTLRRTLRNVCMLLPSR